MDVVKYIHMINFTFDNQPGFFHQLNNTDKQ